MQQSLCFSVVIFCFERRGRTCTTMKKHGFKQGQVDPDIFISKSNELIRQLRYPRRRLFTGRKPMTELDSGVLQSAVSKIVIMNK